MKLNSILRSVALAAALASTVPLLAKPFTKTISIAQSAKIGKADLQAGEYRLQIDGNKATVQKGKQILAEAEGRWENRDTRAAGDSRPCRGRRTSERSPLFGTKSRFRIQ